MAERKNEPTFTMRLNPGDGATIEGVSNYLGDTGANSIRRVMRFTAKLCELLNDGWEIQMVKKGERPKTLMLL